MLLALAGGAFTWIGLGLALGALVLVRRRVVAAQPRTIDVEQVRLGPHHALHVVTVDGKRLLVGTGAQAAPVVLCELAPTAAPPERGGE
jgi:hypothetical protein